jgi:hypothetical protein
VDQASAFVFAILPAFRFHQQNTHPCFASEPFFFLQIFDLQLSPGTSLSNTSAGDGLVQILSSNMNKHNASELGARDPSFARQPIE